VNGLLSARLKGPNLPIFQPDAASESGGSHRPSGINLVVFSNHAMLLQLSGNLKDKISPSETKRKGCAWGRKLS